MKLKLMLISLIARHCSRKSFATLAHKIKRGGGGHVNTFIFESPARRPALAKWIACSLLVATISVCMLPDAKADGFSSPSGIGTTIFEDQFGSGAVAAKFIAQDVARRFTFYNGPNVRLENAPTGLTIVNGRRSRNSSFGCRSSGQQDCIEIDLGWSSAADVSSDTTVNVQVQGIQFALRGGVDTNAWYTIASFTIRPTIKELRVSTPTNSSAVTEAGSTSTFTVRLGGAPSGNVTVDVSLSDTSEASISPNSLSFTSTNYNTAQTVTVTGKDDSISDGTQSYNVVLNPSSTADSGYNGLSNVNVAMTTTDDDPGLSIANASVTEGDSGSVDLTFTVTLSPAATAQVTVNYADAGSGTATSGTDYTAVTAGMLTFAATETSKTITVSVTGDTTAEADETIVITLSSASSGANIVTASGTGTITNDDAGLSIDSPSVTEGDSSSVDLTFTVTLSPAATTQVTVNYADAGSGTATSGTDYTAVTAGMLTFAVGDTSKTITVSVTGDTIREANETVVVTLSGASGAGIVTASGTGTITDNDSDVSVLDELDTEIVGEVALEVTTSVLTAIGNRIASVVGGAAVVSPLASGFADGGLLSTLERAVRHSRERDRGLQRSEMSLYRSLDGASFVYSPSASLGASGSADASGDVLSGGPTVWGSVDYRKLSGRGADALRWDGELASVNIGTDMLSESGVLFGLAIGASKGSFGYQGSTGDSGGAVKMRVNTLNPYVGWTLSELASLWAAVGYGKGKINYNDDDIGEVSSKMSLTSAALGGRYRLSSDGSADGRLIQVDLKGEAWGLETKVKGNQRRPTGSKSRAHGVRIAIERHRSSVLESGASLVLSGEAGLRWDGGDGDTGTGFEIGGSADYSDSATGMKVIGTARALVEHESDRKQWGASLTAGSNLGGQNTGLTYRSSLSHGQAESGVDSLWDGSAVSRASSEENSLVTRLEAEVGYRMYGMSGLHTPYVGFGVEDGSRRDYRIGMRYAGGSAVSSGLEFERREARSKRPDHRVMLTGQMNW